MSSHAISRPPEPYNEPVKSYAPGSPEREELRVRLAEMESQPLEIPLVIGGEEVRTGDTFDAVMPHRRSHGGMAGLVTDAVGGARRDLPSRGGAARGPVAADAERGDDARPVEDGAPGGDRRGLRADRLPPLQRQVHDSDLRGAADL